MDTLKYKIKLIRNYISKVFIKDLIESNPALFIKIQDRRYRNTKHIARIATTDTDIVIEGFPRSANSFSTRAFQAAQLPNVYKVGNHMHSYAQIIYAAKLNLPIIVLVRKPADAVRSLGAHRLQILNHRKEHPDNYFKGWNIEWDIKYYIKFYTELLKYTDKVTIAPFEEVISDFGKTIERTNQKFGTDFKKFDHTKENVDSIFAAGWFHLSPSKERENYKKTIKELLSTPRCQELLKEANEVYNKYLEKYS